MPHIEAPNQPRSLTITPQEPLEIPVEPAVSMLPVQRMQAVLAEYADRRAAFRRWLLEQLQMGIHYGVPPGCEPRDNPNPLQWKHKPSLYKAGAQFICDLLMLRAEFEPDAVAWKMAGEVVGTYVLKCTLRLVTVNGGSFFHGRKTGDIIGEGRGAASRGVKKRDDNAAIKIAEKCAMTDAVLNALGLADLFTQDDNDAQPNPQAPRDESKPVVQSRDKRQADPLASEKRALWAAWAKQKDCVPTTDNWPEFLSWVRLKIGANSPDAPIAWSANMIKSLTDVLNNG